MIVKDWSRPSLMRRPASRANVLDRWMKENGAELHLQVTKYHRHLQVSNGKEQTGKKLGKLKWFCFDQILTTLISREKLKNN